MAKKENGFQVIVGGFGAVLVGGFAWIGIRAFGDLPFFQVMSPMMKIVVSVIGVIVVVYLLKQVFGVTVKRR